MDSGQTGGVVTRKALAAGQRIGVDLHLVAQGLQALMPRLKAALSRTAPEGE